MIYCYKKALQMIDCFKSVIQLDLSGLKPETVLKSRVTRMTTLINAKKNWITHYSQHIYVVKIIGFKSTYRWGFLKWVLLGGTFLCQPCFKIYIPRPAMIVVHPLPLFGEFPNHFYKLFTCSHLCIYLLMLITKKFLNFESFFFCLIIISK